MEAGDVVVVLREKDHAVFQREGMDLRCVGVITLRLKGVVRCGGVVTLMLGGLVRRVGVVTVR